MDSVPILVALGSNMGDSVAILNGAVERLGDVVEIDRVSTFVRSAPMYVTAQPAFVNAVLSGGTVLGPFALLDFFKAVEGEFGRQSRVRNGPRELDVDLVAYGSLMLRSARLQIPHARLAERRFVLQPLAEVAPGAVLPGFPPMPTMLAATEAQAGSVQLISDAALSI